MNCLEYALSFWKANPDYIILYNSDHVINVPQGIEVYGFLGLDYFGEEYFIKAFHLNEKYKKILLAYFRNGVFS